MTQAEATGRQTRRERQREATYDEIKRIARRQMAEQGTAAVSLRAIAGGMGVTPPALYRYYASRDELLTALIVEDYNALGDALERAWDARRDQPTADQLYTVGLAYREWVVTHGADYELILGNPIPGYHAPAEITQPAARRGFGPFLVILANAWGRGELTIPTEYAETPAPLEPALDQWRAALGIDAPTAIFRLALALWGRLHGLLMLELFGHLGAIIGDAAPLYNAELRSALTRLGMRPPAS